MKTHLALLFLFTTLFANAQSQNSRTISGYVEDQQSAERLVGVNLYLPNTQTGTTTNAYGFFSLRLPDSVKTLKASYLGYATQTVDLPEKGGILLIQLAPLATNLNEVVVTAEPSAKERVEDVEMSTIDLPIQAIKDLPMFMGEVDVIKAIQLLPGVQSGNEGTTGLYVRGGSPDQNLILLDGVPVYNVSHLFGFFSVFNADALKNVSLTKGGFPARFGGRLSSVLEIDMKEGNMKEFHGEGSVGLIASKLTLEGPLWKDKTSFLLSGRRTYIDLLTLPFQQDGFKQGYYFTDVNAKINHVFSQRDRLYASLYTGLDKFYTRNTLGGDNFDAGLKWGNTTAALRWNHLFNNNLFANFTALFSRYNLSIYQSNELAIGSASFEYFSRVQDYGVKADLEYHPNANHHLRFGGSYTYHQFRPGAVQVTSQSGADNIDSLLELSESIYSHDAYVYVEDEWTINQRLQVQPGLHFSVYNVDGETFTALQPRLSSRYLIKDNLSVKASFATMQQYVHLLSNTGFGLPSDLWVSSTGKVPPQNSWQVATGVAWNFSKDWEFSPELYYKEMNNLIEYKEGASYLTNRDWQDAVETNGKGKAYGLELLLRKNTGKYTGWIGYTLAWSNRQFDNLNKGNEFPYRFDRRHDISVVFMAKFTERLHFSSTWVYGTGNAITMSTTKYYGVPGSGTFQPVIEQFSDRNGIRMAPYHRLDLSLTFLKKTSWGESSWNISVYNAYNRQNPFFLYIGENNGEKVAKQVSLFPILPSISYQFKF